MKLLRTSAVLLAATAAFAAAMLAMDVAQPSTMAAQAHDRGESHETAGPESWAPDTQMLGFAPSAASWVGVFNANWR